VVLRLFGGVICGNALLSWLVRNAAGSGVTRTLLLVFFIDWFVTAVVGLLGQLSGALNALGWSTVGLAVLWTLAFGYFRFMKAGAS